MDAPELRVDRDDILRRFLEYVRIETTSDEDSPHTPSTEGQWNLARLLAQELTALGVHEVRLDEHCYVYGMLPERLPDGHPRAGQIPAVGFIAHMDVSPAVSGKDVKPIVHKAYAGGPLALPGDPTVILKPEVDAPLGDCVGLDIVTSDGTTLLGADDKAGVAVIMGLLKALVEHPDIPHGPLYVAFTPDEEIGRGVDKFDTTVFGAEVAYTVDGEGMGEIEDETFCADTLIVTFCGVNVHPGYAKGKLINAIKMASAFVDDLPKGALSPETTEGREGYVHPTSFHGNEELARVKLLIRDFEAPGLAKKQALLTDKARMIQAAHPGSEVDIEVQTFYRNMKQIIDQRPEVTAFADEAVRAVGLDPCRNPIRGGTDGARLSFLGIPTPNIFTGGHNFHAKREWVPVDHMVLSAEICLHLVTIWAEKGEKSGRLAVE